MRPTDVLVLAGALLPYALVSARAERSVVSPPMAFAALGLAVGSAGLGLVEPSIDGAFIHDLAEITLALTLFTDASRIDLTELDRRHAIPLRLLGAGLPLAMLAGTGAAWALFPALGVWGAATLGVILAPTDAALGQAVVSNDSVPQRIRQALNVESGLNDGLAFPALLIVASLAAGTHDRDAGGWAAFVGAQVVLGPLAGAAIGAGGGRLVELALARGWTEELYLRLAALALPLVAYALAETVEGNGFLAAFACGVAVAATTVRLRGAADEFGEAEGQLLALAVFVLFGATLLPDLAGLGWRHVLYALLALTVLRMAPVALSLAGLGLAPANGAVRRLVRPARARLGDLPAAGARAVRDRGRRRRPARRARDRGAVDRAARGERGAAGAALRAGGRVRKGRWGGGRAGARVRAEARREAGGGRGARG